MELKKGKFDMKKELEKYLLKDKILIEKYDKYHRKELISFIKKIKKEREYGLDKHLCDHLLWIVEEHYKRGRK